MEFLRSILRRHFARKLVVASLNVGCFLRPWGYRLTKVALVPSPSGRLLWIYGSPREKWNITLGKEFFDNTQRRKTLTKNVKKRIVNNWQLFLEPEWALSQVLWLGGHEGERNNCFSKIQLVGKKYRDKTTLASKTRFSRHCFGFQSRRFSLLVGYNI